MLKLAPIDRQRFKHFLAYTKANIIVKKQALKGANSFYINVKCLGKTYSVVGNFIDVSETKTENYYKELFLKTCLEKTMDDIFNFYVGNKKPEYFNRDVCKSISSKLKLWTDD